MAGVPSDDDFFYNVAKETTTAIVQAIVLKRKATRKTNIRINMEEIASYAYYDGLKELKDSIGNISHKDLADEVNKASKLFEQILSSPQEYFSKVSTTLRSSLNIMTNGNIGKVLGSASENNFVERLEDGRGIILVVQTGTMLARETANIVGKEVISMIQSVVGRYYLSGKTFKTPLCLYIDELSNVVYRGIQDLYNKGRSAGVWIMGMTQSIADMIAVIGEDGAEQLLDNTNTKIIMRVQDLASAEKFAQLGGTVRKNSPIMSSAGGVTSREIEEFAILPHDVLRLDKREFYYFGFEGQFFGKTNAVKPASINIQFPNILQNKKTEATS
ncbi:MAG TPA: conjugal transfer protein TraD [Epsilonproteobacteria bacterium]|nr:conjugal transfer protein TraD [Campylobacterota bacterium]